MFRKLFTCVVALALVLIAAPGQAVITWDSASPVQPIYSPTGSANSSGQKLYYAYAPSVIQDGADMRIWTCHNSESGVVEDDIFSTVINANGVASSASVLTKSSTGWDSFHVCDPSVVRADSVLEGVTYKYAMFYLGNDLDASAHNQIGVAFSHSLSGPWIKAGEALIEFEGPDPAAWGVGQPSATSIDPDSGTVLLFWVEGYGVAEDTKTYRAQIELGGALGPVVGPKLQVTADGLFGSDASTDWLNNADFAYDAAADRFYAVREQHPYPITAPNYIGQSLEVVSISGTAIWGRGGTWQHEGVIDVGLTGSARNHNAGIVRTEFGTLPESSEITIVYTTACESCSDSLWKYQLAQVTGAIG